MSDSQQTEACLPPSSHEVQQTGDSGDLSEENQGSSSSSDNQLKTREQQHQQQEGESRTDPSVPPLVADNELSTSPRRPFETENGELPDIFSPGGHRLPGSLTTTDASWDSSESSLTSPLPDSQSEITTTESVPKRQVIFIKSLQVVAQVLSLVFRAIETIMNAAITIFGLGVGVGLILGDSLRSPDQAQAVFATSDNNTNLTASAGAAASSTVSVVVRPATPSCRATIRRSRLHRVQEAPSVGLANGNSHLPAQ